MQVPWPVALVAPLLAATPIVLAWALLAVFAPLANVAAATTRSIDHSSLAPVAGLAFGGLTVAGVVVVGVAALESWRRPGAPSLWLAPLTSVAAGCVLTPLALLVGARWLAPRAAGRGDPAKLFEVLRDAYEHTGSWVLAGLVLGALVTVVVVKLGRFAAVTAWVQRLLEAWRAAGAEARPDPEAWRR